jgi:hypothetical protein
MKTCLSFFGRKLNLASRERRLLWTEPDLDPESSSAKTLAGAAQ